MEEFKKQYNQIWKDMGFITDGDNFGVNLFRGAFWITAISIIVIPAIFLFLEFMWYLDYVSPGIWQ